MRPGPFKDNFHRFILFSLILPVFIFYGCQGPKRIGSFDLQVENQLPCHLIDAQIDFKERIDALNLISHAYDRGCYDRVIRYGRKAQSDYRFKTFSILKETGDLFLPDGTLTDYVLESYERAYLSFLIAASYDHLRQFDESKVELRTLDHELMARLYNYGEDPVNILLQAVLWEKQGEIGESRVDWRRLQDQGSIDESARAFARRRTEAIDRRAPFHPDWRLYAIDSFPEIAWRLTWVDSKSGYFLIEPMGRFPEDCASETGIELSTRSWFYKIAMRHRGDYHPLLHLESWIRLPIGIVYGAATFAFGTGVAVGGCALDGVMRGPGDLCNDFIRAGFEVIKESPEVVRKTLEPDLRHWENVPSGFLATTEEDLNRETCFHRLSPQGQKSVRRIF